MVINIIASIDGNVFFWYSMYMARITRISTDVARQVLHSMVAKVDDKYHSKGISKTTFKKEVLGKIQGQNLGILRSGQKFISRNEMKHSVKELSEFLKAHPKFAPNRRTLEKFGARAYEGSELRQDFNNEEFLKRVDRYAVGEQKEQDASKNTGPTKAELEEKARQERGRQYLNRFRSIQARDAEAKGITPFGQTSVTSGMGKNATTTATGGPPENVTIAGKSKVAGADIAAKVHGQSAAIPGGISTPASGNHPVQLVGGIGRHVHEPSQDASIPGTGIPTVGAPDLRATSPAHPDSADTPSADGKDDKDDIELPSMDDIDKNLPFAA